MSNFLGADTSKSKAAQYLPKYKTGERRAEAIARKMSNMFEVKVVAGDYTPCVDLSTKTVYIPAYNPYDEAHVIDMLHFIAHEVGHLVYTDMTSLRGTVFKFLNVLEDQRVNALQQHNWPGLDFSAYEGRIFDRMKQAQIDSRESMKSYNEKNSTEEQLKKAHEVFAATVMLNRFVGALLLKCYGKSDLVIREHLLEPLNFHTVKNDPDNYEMKWYTAFKNIEELCVQDWRNIISMAFLEVDAQAIFDEIKNLLPEDYEDHVKNSGSFVVVMTKEELEEFLKGMSGNGSGKGSGATVSLPEGYSGNGQGGSTSKSNGLHIQIVLHEDTKKSVDDLKKDSKKSSSRSSGQEETEALSQVGDDGMSDDGMSDVLKKAVEDGQSSSKNAAKDTWRHVEYSRFKKPKDTRPDLRKVLESKSKFFYNRLFDIVVADDNVDYDHGHRSGKLVKLNKYRVSSRLYSKVENGKSPETVNVTIICDYSGSMSGHEKCVAGVSGSLAVALTNLKIKVQMLGFNSRTANNVYEIIPLSDGCTTASLSYLHDFRADGGTPMGEILPYVLENLVVPTVAEKKLVFLVTDGYPNDSGSVIDCLNVYKRYKDIEFFGIGIGSNDLHSYISDVVTFQDFDKFQSEGANYFFKRIEKFLAK